jgi:hypothetical protein
MFIKAPSTFVQHITTLPKQDNLNRSADLGGYSMIINSLQMMNGCRPVIYPLKEENKTFLILLFSICIHEMFFLTLRSITS